MHFISYLQKERKKEFEDKHESFIKNNYQNKHNTTLSQGEQQHSINKSVKERINEWEQDVGHEPSQSSASCSRCIQPTPLNISFKNVNSSMEIVIEPHINTSESTRKADKTAADEEDFNLIEKGSSCLKEETPTLYQMEEDNFVKMER